jgi:hypothetical protein
MKINIFIFIIMDNSINPTNSILDTNTGQFSNFQSEGSSNWFVDSFKNISVVAWIIIILLLAFLGFNIFAYLAYGTQELADFFGPLTAQFLGIFAFLTGRTIEVAAEGTQNVVNAAAYGSTAIIDTSAEVIDLGLDKVQDVARNVQSISTNPNFKINPIDIKMKPIDITIPAVDINIPAVDIMANNTLNKALNTSAQTRQIQNAQGVSNYTADDSHSTIQTGGGKAGWCFIGEDRGFRSCAEVGPSDQCISGDIFPTRDICVNPNLRA